MSTFTMKKGDTLPVLLVTLQDGTPAAINVSGSSSITFRMRKTDAAAHVYKVNKAAAFNTDGIDGKVKVALTAAETDTPGDYLGEFVINWGGGNFQTAPSDGYVAISIVDNA